MMANNTPRHGWPRGRPPLLHIVHGEHMTEAEACARLGVNRNALNSWRNRNRRPDGRRPTLEAAWDFYKGWRKGRRRGRRPVWHTLADGTRITQAGAAA